DRASGSRQRVRGKTTETVWQSTTRVHLEPVAVAGGTIDGGVDRDVAALQVEQTESVAAAEHRALKYHNRRRGALGDVPLETTVGVPSPLQTVGNRRAQARDWRADTWRLMGEAGCVQREETRRET